MHEAKVTVSDGLVSQDWDEITVVTDSGYFVYYYGIDGSGIQAPLIGQYGKTYRLTINVAGTAMVR